MLRAGPDHALERGLVGLCPKPGLSIEHDRSGADIAAGLGTLLSGRSAGRYCDIVKLLDHMLSSDDACAPKSTPRAFRESARRRQKRVRGIPRSGVPMCPSQSARTWVQAQEA